MQVIPFPCLFILDGALFGDGVRPYHNGYMTGCRLLRWDLEVVPAIIYHYNAVSVPYLKFARQEKDV